MVKPPKNAITLCPAYATSITSCFRVKRKAYYTVYMRMRLFSCCFHFVQVRKSEMSPFSFNSSHPLGKNRPPIFGFDSVLSALLTMLVMHF